MRVHDRNVILKIIREFKTITTGELLWQYRDETGKTITARHLYNIVKALEKEGKVTTRLIKMGGHGRTTEITLVSKP